MKNSAVFFIESFLFMVYILSKLVLLIFYFYEKKIIY